MNDGPAPDRIPCEIDLDPFDLDSERCGRPAVWYVWIEEPLALRRMRDMDGVTSAYVCDRCLWLFHVLLFRRQRFTYGRSEYHPARRR